MEYIHKEIPIDAPPMMCGTRCAISERYTPRLRRASCSNTKLEEARAS